MSSFDSPQQPPNNDAQESLGHQRQILLAAMLRSIRNARQGKFVFNMKDFKAHLVVLY